jgi:hypothetical protein
MQNKEKLPTFGTTGGIKSVLTSCTSPPTHPPVSTPSEVSTATTEKYFLTFVKNFCVNKICLANLMFQKDNFPKYFSTSPKFLPDEVQPALSPP